MRDGTYQVTMSSPMGVKKGLAEIQPEKGRVVLNILGGENLFCGDFAPRYVFETTGVLKTAVSELSASLEGSIAGNRLTAVLHTEQGSFSMEGVLADEGE